MQDPIPQDTSTPRQDAAGATRLCAKCGLPVDRLKDSYKVIGDQLVHGSCPQSPEMKAVPVVQATPPGIQFIRVEDAARMLSVSVKTIQRRIRTGELPAQRLKGTADGGGRTILVDQADVLALLEPYPTQDQPSQERPSADQSGVKSGLKRRAGPGADT